MGLLSLPILRLALSTVSLILIINPLFSQVFVPPVIITDDNSGNDDPPDTLELPIGKPYGGGIGYFPILTPGDCEITVNSNDFNNLKNTVENADYGDKIYIDDDLSIEVPAYATINVPDGVTLASGRGNGSNGALIYSNSLLDDNYFDYPAITAGNDVEITGIRLRGPEGTASSSNYGLDACGIKQEDGKNLEVHNCEIYNWYVYGVYLIESDSAYIHHNYIHNNQNPHIGYGVCNRNKTSTTIEYNIFNHNRHDIAGVKNTNMTPPSYTAQFNLVGPDGISHRFDMHGCGYTDAWGCPDMYEKDDAGSENLAGRTINILNNYFLSMNSPQYHSVVIRGIPEDIANITDNYFPDEFMVLPDYPVRQTLMWGDAVDGECKPIDTSFEWNLATGGGGTDPLSNGDCVYNGILQIEPNHINFVNNYIGNPIFIRLINWDYNSSQNWVIVGPEVRFELSDINSFEFDDLNNDGRTDIYYQNYVSWSGVTEWEYTTENYNIDPNHVIDFNGDGKEDRLSITNDNSIW